MIDEYNKRYMPFSALLLKGGDEIEYVIPALKDYEKINNKTTAYVCENFAYREPVNDLKKFIDLL